MEFPQSNQNIDLKFVEGVNQLVKQMNRDQLLWLGGYLTGLSSVGPQAAESFNGSNNQTSTQGVPTSEVKIIVGSHSGNGQKVAAHVEQRLAELGIKASIQNMATYPIRQLKEEAQVLFVVSTHGEGEPPDVAANLYEFLSGKKSPKLAKLSYGVIALGDSSYARFCQTGIDFNNFLSKAGGKALHEPILLDTDFSLQLSSTIDLIAPLYVGTSINGNGIKIPTIISEAIDRVVHVEVADKILLNGRGSEKENFHIELNTEDKGLNYEPGDALEVYANNDHQLVAKIVYQLGFSGDETVTVDGKEIALNDALGHHYEITLVTPPVLKKYASFLGDEKLNKLLDSAVELDKFLSGTDLLELVSTYPAKLTPSELIGVLRRLAPRLYSISSSPLEVGEEIHVTVGAVRYTKNDRTYEGVCSVFLADRVEEGAEISVKVRSNLNFRLPADSSKPIIMIGAGTGIAPFRAFVQHRSHQNSKGKNWLFFGDQHLTTDFLYQSEWLQAMEKGNLTRMHVAFSRDQEEKLYVQHRMLQNGEVLYQWVNDGAYIYICGDMKKMAKDVKAAWLSIIETHGKMSSDEATEYFKELKNQGRYLEDVY